jgi:hypothetical protein
MMREAAQIAPQSVNFTLNLLLNSCRQAQKAPVELE